jgi:serine/threonine-protein kinase
MTDRTTLGKYEIIKEIGRGGFSVVYQVRDPTLDRVVALKVLAPHLTWEPGFAARFQREARTAARLQHPHIVTVYETDEEDGQLYIAMEYLAGRTLGQVIREEGPLPVERTADLLAQVADALDYAHGQGVLHRDVKPANVMVAERQGRLHVTLMDFGLVKAMSESSTLTSTGTTLGSPEYMAPEQADPNRRDEVGPATDLYALGIVAYQMLTGRVPFPGNTPATLNAHLHLSPPDPRQVRPDLPERVAAVLRQALSKAPDERYSTGAALVAALRAAQPRRAAQKPKPARGRRAALWGGVGLLAVALLAGGIWIGSLIDLRPMLTWTPQPTSTRDLANTLGGTPAPLVLTSTPEIGATRVSQQDGMVMVYVPKGTFWMGSTDLEIDDVLTACSDCQREWYEDEKPRHEVYVDAFWIDRTEVTNAQYEKCVDAGSCTAPSNSSSYTREKYYGEPEFEDYPVIWVYWAQAQAYCAWAGRRLPTEAEWEKAARGTDGRIYLWGSGFYGSRLNFCDVNCPFDYKDADSDDGYADTAPVGSYLAGASPYGALDMAGNVWEWVADWYDAGYYAGSPAENPSGPDSGEYRVLRGGSWYDSTWNARAAVRLWNTPGVTNFNYGVRCVVPISGPGF